MKCKTSDLIQALKNISPILGTRTTVPILSCVRLRSAGGILNITASDFDQYQVEEVECEGGLEPCLVNFNGLSNSLGGESVELKLKNKKLGIFSSLGAFHVSALDAEEFPHSPKLEGGKKIGVNCVELAGGVRSAAWSAATNIGRYDLNSVHILGNSSRLRVESTNGRELSVVSIPLISSDFEGIVPLPFASQFCDTLLRKGSELSMTEKHLQVSHDSGFFVCKQVEGKYPDTKNILSATFDPLGSLDVPLMQDLFRRCNLFQEPARTPVAVLRFSGAGVGVGFISGEASLELEAPGRFEEYTAHVNVESFYKCLKNVTAPVAEIYCDKKTQRGMLRLQSGNLFIYTTQIM